MRPVVSSSSRLKGKRLVVLALGLEFSFGFFFTFRVRFLLYTAYFVSHIYKIQKKGIKGASSSSIIGSTLDHRTGILGSTPFKTAIFFRLFNSPFCLSSVGL